MKSKIRVPKEAVAGDFKGNFPPQSAGVFGASAAIISGILGRGQKM
tara:strand:- start:73 stop:210 length:138 start_codon:yes stop_codon:yes gene_type:complete